MRKKHIVSIDDLSDSEVRRIFREARVAAAQVPTGRSELMMTAFFEPSTRTKLSFEIAAHRLGLRWVSFDASSSSLKKGESFEQTLLTLASLGPEIVVTRTNCTLEHNLLKNLDIMLINGGDGTHEHPTQALLDCFTLINALESDDLAHKRVLIVGDLAHSRVARSNIKLMHRLGARLSVLAPASLRGSQLPWHIESYASFGEIKDHFDAVIILRLQKERLVAAEAISDAEYFAQWGLCAERFALLGPRCFLMHPGPVNEGVEIAGGLIAHERSLVHSQVANGVKIRGALMRLCLDERPDLSSKKAS